MKTFIVTYTLSLITSTFKLVFEVPIFNSFKTISVFLRRNLCSQKFKAVAFKTSFVLRVRSRKLFLQRPLFNTQNKKKNSSAKVQSRIVKN